MCNFNLAVFCSSAYLLLLRVVYFRTSAATIDLLKVTLCQLNKSSTPKIFNFTDFRNELRISKEVGFGISIELELTLWVYPTTLPGESLVYLSLILSTTFPGKSLILWKLLRSVEPTFIPCVLSDNHVQFMNFGNINHSFFQFCSNIMGIFFQC